MNLNSTTTLPTMPELPRQNAVIKKIYITNKILKKSIAQSVRSRLGKKSFGPINGMYP
jgi:hypothetical protein